MENKDLIVNGQLEDIQTNLNEFIHNQKIEKKEETHAKQMTEQEQRVAKVEQEKQRLEETLKACQLKLKDQQETIKTFYSKVSNVQAENARLVETIEHMMN